MRAFGAAGLLLRRLRSERGIVLLTVVLVAATAFAFGAAPRVFNRIADDALRQAVASAAGAARNVTISMRGSLPAGGGGGVGPVEAYGDGLAAQVPASISALVSDREVRVTTPRFAIFASLPYDTRIALRYQSGLTAASTLVAGRWPVDRGLALHPLPVREFNGPEPPPDTSPTTILEVALSKDVAADLGIALGDRLSVAVDTSDPLAGIAAYSGFRLAPAAIEVVGLYEPIDPNGAYWSSDASLDQVTYRGTDRQIAFAMAYVSAGMYGNLWTSRLPFRYEWQLAIDPGRLDAGQLGQLEIDVRRLGLVGTVGATSADGVLVQTGLPRILDRFASQQATAQSVLTIAAIGPLGLAVGAIGMVALLLLRQRARALALARGRGASTSLVLGTELWEALILAGGAALAGLLLAIVLVPARPSPLSPALALGIGAGAIALLLAVTWSSARRELGPFGRDDAPVLRVSPRRLVLEMTIVAISIAATLLLRDRGVTIGTASGAAGGLGSGAVIPSADPLLASVPLLSGLAAGILAARLYPLPIRLLGWLAARRRDVVPVLGLRTVARQPASANVSLLVLMLTAAFCAFCSVTASSLDRGQVVTSYVAVGADYRVQMLDRGPLPPALAPVRIPGVSAVAMGIIDPSAQFASTPGQPATMYVQAIDPGPYEQVVAGTAADPSLPSDLLAAPLGSEVGSAANPIPAILSTSLPSGSPSLSPGATFQMSVEGQAMVFRLVEQRPSFPGITDRATFAVVPFNWIEAAVGRPVSPSATWIRGSGDVGQPLAATVAGQRGSIRLTSRYDAYAALRDTPLEASIGTGFVLALALAAIYMTLTIIGAMVLSAARRTRDLAYLRTLGVSLRQALGLTIVEHGTPVVLAIVPGLALGIGIAALCLPGLGLGSFVGGGSVPLYVDWSALGIVVAGLLAVVVVAIVAGTWLAGRARLVDALRLDDR